MRKWHAGENSDRLMMPKPSRFDPSGRLVSDTALRGVGDRSNSKREGLRAPQSVAAEPQREAGVYAYPAGSRSDRNLVGRSMRDPHRRDPASAARRCADCAAVCDRGQTNR